MRGAIITVATMLALSGCGASGNVAEAPPLTTYTLNIQASPESLADVLDERLSDLGGHTVRDKAGLRISVPEGTNVDALRYRVGTIGKFGIYEVIDRGDGSDSLVLSTLNGESLQLRTPASMGSDCIADAQAGDNPAGMQGQVVNFTFTAKCAESFGVLTSKNVGNRLAIVIDDAIISAPSIRTPILAGTGFIEGGWNERAADVAAILRSGPLPVPAALGTEIGDD